MHLSVSQTVRPNGVRRTVHLTDAQSLGKVDIFFDLSDVNVPPPSVLDGFIFAVIFLAMRLGEPVVVEGAMTREALSNLNEFQEAWACWRPSLYRRIEIKPLQVLEDAKPAAPAKAIAAMSGGVDSVFTTLRHAERLLGAASYPLDDSVLMVHGFDVPLERQPDFDALTGRIKPLLTELGLRLRTVRTNIKALNLQDWQDSFIAQLSSCLFNYAHEFRYGIVNSGEAYDELVLPWGQNPCTDYLLSGSTFKTVHDGAGFSRTRKVKLIARRPIATSILKVCWQGEDKSGNCGSCEKCIRTRLNFLAVGERTPACFDGELSLRKINTILLRNKVQYSELVSILNYVRVHDVAGEWVEALSAKLTSYVPPTPMQLAVANRIITVRNILFLLRRRDFSRLVDKVRRKMKR